MTEQKLKKKIDGAKKLVEKLGLKEPYKSETFGAILTWSLIREKVEEELEKPKRVEIGLEKRIEKLAKDAGVTVGQLKHIFSFKDDLGLLVVGEGTDKEKQLQATLLILTGFSYHYGKEEILSIDLKRRLRKLGIRALGHLTENLSEYSRFILPKIRGSASTYEMTVRGKEEGLKIIKEFARAGEPKA